MNKTWLFGGNDVRIGLHQSLLRTADKKMRLIKAALREGYKTLISEEEVCISRVGYMVTTKTCGWNVAYCRVTDCRRDPEKYQAPNVADYAVWCGSI